MGVASGLSTVIRGVAKTAKYGGATYLAGRYIAPWLNSHWSNFTGGPPPEGVVLALKGLGITSQIIGNTVKWTYNEAIKPTAEQLENAAEKLEQAEGQAAIASDKVVPIEAIEQNKFIKDGKDFPVGNLNASKQALNDIPTPVLTKFSEELKKLEANTSIPTDENEYAEFMAKNIGLAAQTAVKSDGSLSDDDRKAILKKMQDALEPLAVSPAAAKDPKYALSLVLARKTLGGLIDNLSMSADDLAKYAKDNREAARSDYIEFKKNNADGVTMHADGPEETPHDLRTHWQNEKQRVIAWQNGNQDEPIVFGHKGGVLRSDEEFRIEKAGDHYILSEGKIEGSGFVVTKSVDLLPDGLNRIINQMDGPDPGASLHFFTTLHAQRDFDGAYRNTSAQPGQNGQSEQYSNDEAAGQAQRGQDADKYARGMNLNDKYNSKLNSATIEIPYGGNKPGGGRFQGGNVRIFRTGEDTYKIGFDPYGAAGRGPTVFHDVDRTYINRVLYDYGTSQYGDQANSSLYLAATDPGKYEQLTHMRAVPYSPAAGAPGVTMVGSLRGNEDDFSRADRSGTGYDVNAVARQRQADMVNDFKTRDPGGFTLPPSARYSKGANLTVTPNGEHYKVTLEGLNNEGTLNRDMTGNEVERLMKAYKSPNEAENGGHGGSAAIYREFGVSDPASPATPTAASGRPNYRKDLPSGATEMGGAPTGAVPAATPVAISRPKYVSTGGNPASGGGG